MKMPVQTRYVLMTGILELSSWKINDEFTLAGSAPTYGNNVASCFSMDASNPHDLPELIPLLDGLVTQHSVHSVLSADEFIRIDVGTILPDANGTKTLVCAAPNLKEFSYTTFTANVGEPGVRPTDARGNPVGLRIVPIELDLSTLVYVTNLRFTHLYMATAVDPLRENIMVHGYAEFAFEDQRRLRSKEFLLLLTGILVALGASSLIELLRLFVDSPGDTVTGKSEGA